MSEKIYLDREDDDMSDVWYREGQRLRRQRIRRRILIGLFIITGILLAALIVSGLGPTP